MADARSADPPPTQRIAGPSPSYRLEYAGPGAWQGWSPAQRRRAAILCGVIVGLPLAAVVYFHAGVAWARRRENAPTLFSRTTGTDFYETWLSRVPLLVVTSGLGAIALGTFAALVTRRCNLWWVWVPALCVAVWTAFFVYFVIAADGPFP